MKKRMRKPATEAPAVQEAPATSPSKEASPDNSLVKVHMEEAAKEEDGSSELGPVLDEATKDSAAATLADELEKLAEGLTYISESDSDFSGVSMKGAAGAEGAASEEELREGLALAPEAALDIMSADDFWDYYTDAEIHGAEEAARFDALRAELEDKLQGVTFVKHDGDEDWQKFIYLVGRAESGDLVGLKAESVET